jgi:diguanylate cyclase (GGDEF)-like protein
LSQHALVAEPAPPVAGVLRKYLESAGFEVQVVPDLDEALKSVRANEPEVVFASCTAAFDGETLCLKLKDILPNCPVVLLYPPDEENPDDRAMRAGADAFLIGPLKRGTVVSSARAMLRIRDLQEAVGRLKADVIKRAEAKPRMVEDSLGGVQSPELAFFKKFILLEVKRSKRYRYPVSLMVISLDNFGERSFAWTPEQVGAVAHESLSVIASSVREIDLAIPFGDDRFLVFLPHTPREGAMTVAQRVKDSVAMMKSYEAASCSIGIATAEPLQSKTPVSFSSLVKDATEALKRAQAAGGNTIEATAERVKRDRISIG